jgi:uncharacterized protein Yka (UPF0111/DUF47 family)
MRKVVKRANSIRFADDVQRIVDQFNVRGNVNETVNQLIRRGAAVESEGDRLERAVRLIERHFAITLTVYDRELSDHDFAAKRESNLTNLRNEVL